MNFEQINSQPEWYKNALDYLNELQGKSKYQREKTSELNEKIHSPERGDYDLEKVKNPESKETKEIFNLTKKFAPEEADTLKIIQDAIANPTEAYSYHVAKDKNKTIAYAQSSYLELRPEAGGKPNEVAIFGGYSLTNKEYWRKGVGAELISLLMREDAEKALKRQQEIKCLVVEGKETSEPFWNNVGLKRLYYEDAEGNFNEAPYIQPPIQWDEETGKALDPETEEIGDKDIKEYTIPEHLMIRMMNNRNEINPEELRPILDIIYFDNYTLYRNEGDDLPTDEAIQYTRDAVNKFMDEFFEALKNAKDSKIYLMDAKEREQKRAELEAKGKKLNELLVEPFFEQPEIESESEKNARFAEGLITEDEIRECWESPNKPIFEHTVKKEKEGKEQEVKFRVQVLSESLKDDLLAELRNSWDEPTFEELRETLELFFEQKKIGHPALLNVEYYVAVDSENKPFAITGIYTDDIYGGAGFATANKLDLENHYLATRLGWFSVSEKYQGSGVGGFLFDWIEKMAKNRGSKVMVVETDDWENEEIALKLYASRGYKQELDIKDYFGPGRDMVNYFAKVEGTQPFFIEEKVTAENKAELLDLGKKIYSAERYKEFEVCLSLFLQQKDSEENIMAPHSFVLRNREGKIMGFSMLMSGIYENAIFSCWEGTNPEIDNSKKELAEALKGYVLSQGRGIIALTREGEDKEFLEYGFQSANDGIPEVFEKGDPTKFLLYSKRL